MSNLLPAADFVDDFVITHISSDQSELSMLLVTVSFDPSLRRSRLRKATLCRLRVKEWGAQQSLDALYIEFRVSAFTSLNWYHSKQRLS